MRRFKTKQQFYRKPLRHRFQKLCLVSVLDVRARVREFVYVRVRACVAQSVRSSAVESASEHQGFSERLPLQAFKHLEHAPLLQSMIEHTTDVPTLQPHDDLHFP